VSDTDPEPAEAPALGPEAPGIHANEAGLLEIRWPRPDTIVLTAELLENLVRELNAHRRAAALRTAVDTAKASTPPASPPAAE
jgi:hypothetical protein